MRANINKKYIKFKEEIEKLINQMSVKELDELKDSEEVRLFDEKGMPTKDCPYSAFTSMITNMFIGKKIRIDGHDVMLNYAGENQLISDIQEKGNYAYSYGISFSLQTIPPERKALLLCDCCIHRWIPGNWKNEPYFNEENINVYIWVENKRIYKSSIYGKYTKEKKCRNEEEYKNKQEYTWKNADKNYYRLYNLKSLPPAKEVMGSIKEYLSKDFKITFLYKNGMDSLGFAKNNIGTGVSVSEKSDIYNSILSHISEIVHSIKGVERVKPTKNARKKLKLDEINFGKELDNKQKNIAANRIKTCINANVLNFEVYYRDNSTECAKEIIEKLQSIFQSNEEITFKIRMCKLGDMGEMLESSESASALKRIKEIDKKLDTATEITACIVLLPGKDEFDNNDPKAAIRCGFALKKRHTQFIVPWNKEVSETTVNSKITSAIEDLCRQLGYIRELDKTAINNEAALLHTPIIGVHITKKVKTIYGEAKYLPLFIEIDYISGKVYVECDAFEHKRVLYREAAFELAHLSLDKEFKEKCDAASKRMFKQKMKAWENAYKDKDILILIEANGKTRDLCNGITDSQIQKYSYLERYCPEEIEVGDKKNSDKINLNNSKIRFIRIRRNGEVPDYFTDLSEKEGYTASSGVFKYEHNYWAIADRPNNKSYIASYKETTYSKPYQSFAERNMIEIYPIQLQKGDNPDEWVHYVNSLRAGAIQYDEATIMPIPIHLAEKLQEYILIHKNKNTKL